MAMKTYQGSCHCGAVRFEAIFDMRDGTSKCTALCVPNSVHGSVPSSLRTFACSQMKQVWLTTNSVNAFSITNSAEPAVCEPSVGAITK